MIANELPNYDLYKKVFSSSSGTCSTAMASGDPRPKQRDVIAEKDSEGH